MFREFKLVCEHFFWALKSKSYRYGLWQDSSVGFYLRRFDKELYDEILDKSYEKFKEQLNETKKLY